MIDILEKSIQESAPVLAQAGKTNELGEISKMLLQIKNSPVIILVCGEFKRGKSTFVNALIGRSICPTDVDICTSVVSMIKYGEKESVKRYYGDFTNIKSEQIDLCDLEKYTVGSANEIDNTIYVEIELPLEELKKGIVVVDTPGVGGLEPRHATLTNYFLPQADVAVFMTDVNEPLTTTEMDFYKNKVLPYSKQNLVVVNKSDLKDNESVEDIKKDTINKIAANTQVESKTINIVAVSSAAEVYSDSNLGESNFLSLRSVLATLVDDYKKALIAGVRNKYVELLDLTIMPLEAQLKQIESPDVNQLRKLSDEKQRIEGKLQILNNPSSEFRLQVNKEIALAREEIVTNLNEISVTIQSDVFNHLLSSPEAHRENGGQWIGMQLNDEIAEVASEVTIRLNRAFEHIASLPQFDGMLNYSVRDFDGQIVNRQVNTSMPLHRRLMSMSSGLGVGALSMAVGVSSIPVVGWIATIGMAAFVAYQNTKDSAHAFVENNLRQMYQQQLSGSLSNLRTYVDSRFQEFQTEWLKVLTERVQTYKSSLEQAISEINKMKQDINQSVSLRTALKNKLDILLKSKKELEIIK